MGTPPVRTPLRVPCRPVRYAARVVKHMGVAQAFSKITPSFASADKTGV